MGNKYVLCYSLINEQRTGRRGTKLCLGVYRMRLKSKSIIHEIESKESEEKESKESL